MSSEIYDVKKQKSILFVKKFEQQQNSAIVLTLHLLCKQWLYPNPLVEKYDFIP